MIEDQDTLTTSESPGVESVTSEAEAPAAPIEVVKEKPTKVSRRDVLRTVYKEAKEKLNGKSETDDEVQGDQGSEPGTEEVKKDESNLQQAKRGPGRPSKTQETPIEPPGWFTAEQKQEFKKLPANMQKHTSTLVNNVISNAQRHIQKAVETSNQAEGVMKAVKPYFNEWNMRGVQVEQGVAQLCAIWDDLHKGREESYVKLIQRIGLNPQKIAQILTGGAQGQNNFQSTLDPVLTKKIDTAYDFAQTQRQATLQQQQQSEQRMWAEVGAGVDQARNEVDQAGNYRYPQLHNQNYVQQIAPLIVQLRRADPNSDWATLARKATDMVERAGEVYKGAPQQQQQGQRRVITPISVRSRGAATQQESVFVKPVKGERRTDTIRRVIEARKREATSY